MQNNKNLKKLKRSNSQIIDNNTILNSLNEFVVKEIESIPAVNIKNESGIPTSTIYPKRREMYFSLRNIGVKPNVDYDQNLTFENTIDQIFAGLNQADIDEIKNHNKWNQNVSDVGLPKEECLKNLQILAAIIKKKKANSPESTKVIQEAVMSNIQDFLNDEGCYGNLTARLESYRITDLQSLVMSNALYQYILASRGILTHFHDHPLSHYAQFPLKKSPINSRTNNNITVFERDHRDEPNHDVRYFDEYIEFIHKSMKSAASVVTPEEMKDFILKNLATKLGYQDVQDKQLKQPESDIKDFVDQYDKDLAKYHKSFNEVFEPKISDDSENDKDILEFIKEAIKAFESKKKYFLETLALINKPNKNEFETNRVEVLKKKMPKQPLIDNFLNEAYLLDLVETDPRLSANENSEERDVLKNKINAKNLDFVKIISEYQQDKISKTMPEIALICKKNSKEDLADKAEKYIKYRDEFPEKQRKEKEEALKNLAESGYLDDISNDQEKENGVIKYIPSKKLLNCVLNPDKSSKDINDYVNAFIPTLNLFDKKSRDQQEENNRILNNVNFQPPERRIGDRESNIIFIAFMVAFALLFIGFVFGGMVFSASPLAASILFGVGAIGLAGTVFVGVKTFLKNRSNNKCNSRSKDTGDRLKNQIKEKLKSVKDVARLVKNEEGWNEFIKPSTELQNEITEIKRLYNIDIRDLYNNKLQSIRKSLVNRFVINDMVDHRMRHPIQPNNKVSLDNFDPSSNAHQAENLDSTSNNGLVQKYEKSQSQRSIKASSKVDSYESMSEDSSDNESEFQKDQSFKIENNDQNGVMSNIKVEDYEKSIHSSIQLEKLFDNGSPNLDEELRKKFAEFWNRTPELYKRLAKKPEVRVQNYIINESPWRPIDKKSNINGKNKISKKIEKDTLSQKQSFLINNYGNQKDSPRTQYRDLMNPKPRKSDGKSLNDLGTFQDKIKKVNATFSISQSIM